MSHSNSMHLSSLVDAIKNDSPLVNQVRNQYLADEQRQNNVSKPSNNTIPLSSPEISQDRKVADNETDNESKSPKDQSLAYHSSSSHDDTGYESGDEKPRTRITTDGHGPDLHVRSHTATTIPDFGSDTRSDSPLPPFTPNDSPSRIGGKEQDLEVPGASPSANGVALNQSSHGGGMKSPQTPEFDPYNPQQYFSREPSHSDFKVTNLRISNQSSPITSPQHTSHRRRSSRNSITAPQQNPLATPPRPSTSRSNDHANSLTSPFRSPTSLSSSALAKRKVSTQSLRSPSSKGIDASSSYADPDSSSSNRSTTRQRPRSMINPSTITSGWDSRSQKQGSPTTPTREARTMGMGPGTEERRPTLNPASQSFFKKTRSLFQGKGGSVSSSASGGNGNGNDGGDKSPTQSEKVRPKSDVFSGGDGVGNGNMSSVFVGRNRRQSSISSLKSTKSARSSLYLVEGIDDLPLTSPVRQTFSTNQTSTTRK